MVQLEISPELRRFQEPANAPAFFYPGNGNSDEQQRRKDATIERLLQVRSRTWQVKRRNSDLLRERGLSSPQQGGAGSQAGKAGGWSVAWVVADGCPVLQQIGEAAGEGSRLRSKSTAPSLRPSCRRVVVVQAPFPGSNAESKFTGR